MTHAARKALLIATTATCALAVLLAIGAGSADARRASDQSITIGSDDAPGLFAMGREDSSDNTGPCDIDSAGDFNGDNYQDFIVGYCHENFDMGTAKIKFGSPDGHEELAPPDTWITMPANSTRVKLGTSVAGGYDVNGDGYDDVVVGAPDGNGGDGAAWVVFGSRDPANLLHPAAVTEEGDIPNGSIALISSRGGDSEAESDDLGAAVAMGPNPRDASRAAVYVADPGNDNSLRSCDGVFDDNCGEVWAVTHFPYAADRLGSWSDNSSRARYTLSLPAPDAQGDGMFPYGCRTEGAFSFQKFGTSIDGGADVTGDGVPDFIVGAPDEGVGDNDGSAHVVSGAACVEARRFGAQRRSAEFCDDYEFSSIYCGVVDIEAPFSGFEIRATRDDAGEQLASLGTSVAIVDYGPSLNVWGSSIETLPGDVNGDGIGEVVVGDPEADVSGSDSGGAWVVYGLDMEALSLASLNSIGVSSSQMSTPAGYSVAGGRPDDQLGETVATAGQLGNSDQEPDILVGSSRGADRDRLYGIQSPSLSQARAGVRGLVLDGPTLGDFSDRYFWIDTPATDGGAPVAAALDTNLDFDADLALGESRNDGMVYLFKGVEPRYHGSVKPLVYEPKYEKYEEVKPSDKDAKSAEQVAVEKAAAAKQLAQVLKQKLVASKKKRAATAKRQYSKCKRAAKRKSKALKACKRQYRAARR